MKALGETMDAEEHRHPAICAAPLDQTLDRRMVRSMKSLATGITRGLRQAQVARDQDAIADCRNHGQVTRCAVQINDESRIVREYGTGIKACLQAPGDTPRTDIPRNVVVEVALVDTELTECGREAVAGMVTDENDTRIAMAFD